MPLSQLHTHLTVTLSHIFHMLHIRPIGCEAGKTNSTRDFILYEGRYLRHFCFRKRFHWLGVLTLYNPPRLNISDRLDTWSHL